MATTHKLSSRNLTRYYVCALMLIGCLALGSHLIQGSATRNIDGMAAIINISGRQRMLSQRIASLAAQYRLGDASARQDLQSTISEFETAHNRLSRGDLADNSGPDGRDLMQQLYFKGPNSIDKEMTAFIANARQVASLPPDDPAMPALQASLFAESRAPLLDALNHVVAVRQNESETKFQQLRRLQWIVLTVMFISLSLEARFIFQPMVHKIEEFRDEILHLASTDALTSVTNRRGFLERFSLEIERMRRYNRPLSILILDADHFKQINDTYGHAAGDAALRSLSQTHANLRPSDLLARIGGEEFAILAPETNLPGAAALAERLRGAIAAVEICFEEHKFSLTISIGVAEVNSTQPSIDTVLQAADRLLYRAKQGGRNCVIAEQFASRMA